LSASKTDFHACIGAPQRDAKADQPAQLKPMQLIPGVMSLLNGLPFPVR
jgi:hypothetical protein